VDKRTDVWALGCCLYEALVGRAAFRGETVTDTLAKIVEREPDWEALPKKTPPAVHRLLRRCLQKDPDRRLRDVGDAWIEIEEAREGQPEARDASPGPTRTPLLLVLTALVAGAIGALAVWSFMRSAEPARERAVQVTSAADVENYPTWSADGGRLAYESNQRGNWDIWVVQLGGGEPVNLTADHAGDDRFPSWSPEGHQIAFLSQREEGWGLYTLSALGGRPRKLTSLAPLDFNPWGAPQWSADGKEIAVSFRSSGKNVADIVSVQSQEARRVALPAHAENLILDLSLSPDGRYFAYIDAIVFNAEVTRLWVVPSSGGEPVPVTDGMTNDWNPTWSRDRRNLFFVSNRGGSMDLWRQRMDEDGKPRGEAEPVTTGLEIRTAAFSPEGGRLAYSRGRRMYDSNIWRVPILKDRLATWGDAEQLTFDNAFIQFFDVSPTRRRLVLSSDRAGNQDLWTLPSGGGEMAQLTTEPTPDWEPSWSPDGKEIVFYAYRSGNRDIWVMPSDGGPARVIAAHPAEDVNPTWSPDGREIAFTSRRSGSRDIWIVAAQGGEPRQITTHPGQDQSPQYSPDGRWLGFERSGSFYRIAAAAKGEPELVARGPGQKFRWSPDGKSVYFTGSGERAGTIWGLSLEDRRDYPLTDLVGRRGRLSFNLATDGRYLYFHWDEEVADIWVMDVAR
jgi:Tol biopolymer transport system component